MTDLGFLAALGLGLGLAALCLLAAGMLARPGGYALGWAVQVVSIGLGFVVTMMFFLGVVFGGALGGVVLPGRPDRPGEGRARGRSRSSGGPSTAATRRAWLGCRPCRPPSARSSCSSPTPSVAVSSARSSPASRPRASRIVALELRTIDGDLADQHYAEHVERDFYPPLRAFVTSGPMVAAVLEGDEAIEVVRALNGATDGRKAAPGTIRGDLSLSNRENLVHGSDSPESATREIAIWFPAL